MIEKKYFGASNEKWCEDEEFGFWKVDNFTHECWHFFPVKFERRQDQCVMLPVRNTRIATQKKAQSVTYKFNRR